MSNKKNHWNQIIQSEPKALSRVGNIIKITGKILKENNQRLVFSEIKSVKIGDQIWTTENLNVDRFSNGDFIPEARTYEEWEMACREGKPAWCFNEYDPNNEELYGRLYNWFAITDPRGLTPMGWHIPTEDEWRILINFLGGQRVAGKKMKNAYGWDFLRRILFKQSNFVDSGTNESGLMILPGGARLENGHFFPVGSSANFWISSFNPDVGVWNIYLGPGTDIVFFHGKNLSENAESYKEEGFSIRCIKDF
jgi:uncharacterized protein (TIGR02145 family)